MTADIVLAVIQVVVVAAGAPLLVGALRTLKARLVGRRGPRVLQPYADLVKCLRKEAVVSTTTSWIFRLTPYVLFSTMVVASLIVPLLLARPVLDFAGLVLLMYLFVLGTFFLALAGLDADSAFGGMGSSREVAVAALAEPTIMVEILALAVRAETTSLGGIESLAEHRASVEGPESKTPPSLLRLSIGLEHPDDLIADLEQALTER